MNHLRQYLADRLDHLAQRIVSEDRTGRPVDLTADERWHAEQRTDLPPVGVPVYRPARSDLAEQVTQARAIALAQETERHLAQQAARDQAIGALASLEDAAVDSTIVFSQAEEYHRLAQVVRRAL